jgi:uncharacterized lipoprotein
MNLYIKQIALAGLVLSLTGCSYMNKSKNAIIPDKGKLYLKSREAAPLQVPAGISPESVGDAFPVPPVPAPAPQVSPGLLPPDSLAEKIAQGKVSADVLKPKPKKSK